MASRRPRFLRGLFAAGIPEIHLSFFDCEGGKIAQFRERFEAETLLTFC